MLENILDGHGLVGGGHSRVLSDRDEGFLVQGQDLIERGIIGHQGARDECLSSPVQGQVIHGQATAQRQVGVETQALGIGHGEQEQIEGAGPMAEPIDIVLTDQALIHPAELSGDFAELG